MENVTLTPADIDAIVEGLIVLGFIVTLSTMMLFHVVIFCFDCFIRMTIKEDIEGLKAIRSDLLAEVTVLHTPNSKLDSE
ncbi:hypothetical protein [Vibrio genomosp. F6]|uniref:Uncharacterized protein n=1 Tax=Vibrio genomosp. F6 str. FF-238 TaxID=1191298 RepID=A0A1E5CL83_9VIBR|nr:hypothetical protein [Vibrio genomosp. F6]OEE69462.1 hypothetical protein A130_09255 [Vibrio genomosp. F6 str. FF-238]